MPSASLTFRYALLCDDVRREDNGKLIIIGMYGGDIALPMLPSSIFASLVAAFDASEKQSEKINLTVTLNAKPMVAGDISVEIAGAGLAHIILPSIPLNFDKEGTMVVTLKTTDGMEHHAWTGKVRVK